MNRDEYQVPAPFKATYDGFHKAKTGQLLAITFTTSTENESNA